MKKEEEEMKEAGDVETWGDDIGEDDGMKEQKRGSRNKQKEIKGGRKM
jgi:hypothetical protein